MFTNEEEDDESSIKNLSLADENGEDDDLESLYSEYGTEI